MQDDYSSRLVQESVKRPRLSCVEQRTVPCTSAEHYETLPRDSLRCSADETTSSPTVTKLRSSTSSVFVP